MARFRVAGRVVGLWLALAVTARVYHAVPLQQLGTTKWTHVETCGRATLVKAEADGDLHIRLDAAGRFIVAEILGRALPAPKVGQWVQVRGISRIDKTHGWPEVHPVEAISIVSACRTPKAGSRKATTTK